MRTRPGGKSSRRAVLPPLDEVACSRDKVAMVALGLYSGSSFDFVDCVLAAEHEVGGRDVLTFDKKLGKLLEKVR